jgi:hypothetical protein
MVSTTGRGTGSPAAPSSATSTRRTCLLVSAPLNLAAGVASPANAITIR